MQLSARQMTTTCACVCTSRTFLTSTNIWHWVSVVAEANGESGPEGSGRGIHQLVAQFNADDGLLASTWMPRLQQAFNVLTDIFDWVGLWTNVGKTVSMVCQLCCAIGGYYTEAHGSRMAGEGMAH